MKAQEKAKELVEKFKGITTCPTDYSNEPVPDDHTDEAKECAILCCGQIIENTIIDTNLDSLYMFTKEYWEDVKIEIYEIKPSN